MNKKTTYQLSINTWKKIFLFITFIVLFFPSFGQKYTEYEVKSAYLFNFSKFVKWPDSSFESITSPFIIGIYKNDGFGLVLSKTIEGRQVNGRNVIIKYYDQPHEIDYCHILFFPKIDKYELLKVLGKLEKKPILTIGNAQEGFCKVGGIINFTKPHSKFRFEINNDVSIKLNLIISSKLLALAKIISEDEIKF